MININIFYACTGTYMPVNMVKNNIYVNIVVSEKKNLVFAAQMFDIILHNVLANAISQFCA